MSIILKNGNRISGSGRAREGNREVMGADVLPASFAPGRGRHCSWLKIRRLGLLNA